MEFIAHPGPLMDNDQRQPDQLLKDHLLDCQKIAESLGRQLNLGHMAGLAALLHDVGKYSSAFQEYIQSAKIDPNSVRRGSVDHSTAGGKLLYDMFHQSTSSPYEKMLAELVGNAIISHHSSSLRDYWDPQTTAESPFLNRVREKPVIEYAQIKSAFFTEVISPIHFKKCVQYAVQELQVLIKQLKDYSSLFLIGQFIYSCVIDADRTNTMLFEQGKAVTWQADGDRTNLFAADYATVVAYLEAKKLDSPTTKINQLRAQMALECDQFADRPTGVYQLSIPTGGGKTFSSLRFALKHAAKQHKTRIIYVVPFTTVIEQNAAVTRKALGLPENDQSHVLEFHSNVVQSQTIAGDNENEEQGLELIKDTWDAPIIFTTMVQFLNTFYASGTRSIRRLHNLMNSVVIFDEVQSVPTKCISMFNEVVNFLSNVGQTTAVLCTATQPALDAVRNNLKLSENGEMIQNLPAITEAFKRVDIVDQSQGEEWSLDHLANFVQELAVNKQNILVILNTKSAVKKLYQTLAATNLSEAFKLVHLSTSMCAAHRLRLFSDITKALKNGQRLICISSQLIEAGVDVSFECVIRSTAGLDSITQAAGRCNRNGEKERQNVYVVKIADDDEKLTYLPEIADGQKITLRLLQDMVLDKKLYNGELLSPAALRKYFIDFFAKEAIEADYPVKHTNLKLMPLMSNQGQRGSIKRATNEDWPLMLLNSGQTIAKFFQVIDSVTQTVLVPYAVGAEFITQLNGELTTEELDSTLKAAQPYTVNLFTYQITELDKAGLLMPLYNDQILALRSEAYSEEYGVTMARDGGIFEPPIM